MNVLFCGLVPKFTTIPLLLGGFGPFNTCCLLFCSLILQFVSSSGSSLCADLEEESVQYAGEFEVSQQIHINCFVSQICNEVNSYFLFGLWHVKLLLLI